MRILRPIIACAFLAGLMPAQDLLIRNARLIPVSGPEIAKTDLLIRDGRVSAIGEGLKADLSTLVVDAAGRAVMPAYVLAATSEGLDRPNENMEVTPFVSVLDSIDPTRPFFDDSVRDGVYSIHILPGDRTVIGGSGRVLRPTGRVVEDMTIVPDGSIKISMVPPQGNRASQMAKLRSAFDDAKRYLDNKEAAADSRPSGSLKLDMDRLAIDRRRETMARLLKKQVTAFTYCGEPGDVIRALALAAEFGYEQRLVLAPGTWKAADLIAADKRPVVLTPEMDVEEMDPETGKMVRRELPAILHKKGVAFAATARPTSLGQRYLWYQAGSLVRMGIPRDVALRSVTLTAAEVIGLGKTKGSIEVGKDGDVLILSDDPLSGRAWVDSGVIEGRVIYERRSDRRLTEVLGLGDGKN